MLSFYVNWQVHFVKRKCVPNTWVGIITACQAFLPFKMPSYEKKKVTSSACNLNCTLAFPQNNYHIWIHSRNYFMHSFHFITQNIKKTLFKVWNFKKVIISTDSSMIFYFKWAVLRRPRWLSGNESIYHSGDMGLIPDPGRSHIPQSN